jgi:Mg-chelatase subunit ChlD
VVLKSMFDGPGMFTAKRPPMHLVIVLDTSGSMGARFRESAGEQSGKAMSKIEVAKESIVGLLHTLQPDDSIAVVAFNDQAEVVVPLTQIKQVDVQDARERLARVRAYGGTSLAEGAHASWCACFACEHIVTHKNPAC